MIATDALLIRLPAAANDAHKLGRLAAVAADLLPDGSAPVSHCHIAHAAAEGQAYVYLHFAAPQPLNAGVITQLQHAMAAANPETGGVRVSRLQKVFAATGASTGEVPAFRYVVETDPETGWMPELGEWYDREHMPGLAAVPGCIHATRYLNHDGGPLSHACYELVTEETKGSPLWLAMTHSEWSSRVRPHFTNTIRTMFTVAPTPSPGAL